MLPLTSATRVAFRRTLLTVSLVVVALGVYGFFQLGSFLAKEDPLQQADAILVLSGTAMTRPLEAADLYLAGYAPQIILTRDQPAGGMPALAARGILFITPVTRTHGVFLQLGIPDEAIVVPERVHGSTAAEAITLRELAARESWRRVIIVSSKYHLRRAGFAFRRELRGTDLQIMMRSTHYEGFDPKQWWRRRSDIREIIRELPKLLGYLLGFGA